MYARVARWEGSDAEAMRATAERIKSQAGFGPPEGVPAKAFKLLIDPESGRSLSVTFFESEEDLNTGDETLSAMNPPTDEMGQRVSVERYEVAVEVSA